jgi:hypothetical protein
MGAMMEAMTAIEYMAYKFLREKQFMNFFDKIEWEEIDGF